MTTLIVTPRASLDTGRRLSIALRDCVCEVGIVHLGEIEQALETRIDAGSVILVHGDPAELLLDFITHCCETARQAPVLIWGAPADPDVVAGYLIQGAKACFVEGENPERLLDAFPVVHSGGHYLPPTVQRIVLRHFVQVSSQAVIVDGGSQRLNDGLTDREREVLELLAAGYSNPEIAERLFLEVGTIKNHVHHILTKLNVSDRYSAARYFKTRQRFTIN